ncbi:DNA-binding GntR family transcriptional regulator [Neorhizobium galegae]|uniref:GntR family transcriptional regulator n=1 Tax=Neorhizobium galegae TaxID=399 RepID=UPI001AE7B278|nr:GntR family transcriptional regulator [Neorhizobium galegae]MBP2563178.1 DNA-binding GntR family transcriptional regulator [Neorhizobium galegae]
MKRKEDKRPLADEIAQAIQLGEFRTGEWLRQIDLEERFSATRFDVRTALEALVVRKEVQHVRNRGYKVPALEPEMIGYHRDVRVILECGAVPQIVANATAEDVARLSALAEAFSVAAKSGTHMDQSRTNREFHEAMHALTGNPVLVETIWSIRDRGRSAPFTIWRTPDTLRQSDEDHHQMVRCIREGNAAGLSEVIESHIRRPH